MAKKGKKSEPKVNQRQKRLQEAKQALEELETNVKEFELDASITKFSQVPLSTETKTGLKVAHYVKMTEIQQKAIVPALQGQDILGAARTGSGKTLAFLIPVIELLYRNSWNVLDGLGAMIISPTRELAIQIYDVLKKIGKFHQLSAGLVIGGKDPQVEAQRIAKLNILIGTPGRILHHMHKTHSFDVSNLQTLVLDEADRILDMGFRHDLNAIVQDLPTTRQTLLYSATQTKSVSDLARLSLNDPTYISAHELNATVTPKHLEQVYAVTEVDEKLNILYGFLRDHVKSKILVFFSSSKQVRFVYETFKKLQPGIPLLHLHGRQKQSARIDATDRFSAAQHSCLFSTDICARGMDFPAVDWVVQVDAPEDAATYIHRVGRSARFDKKGKAFLFLTPTEELGMVKLLEQKKIPITKLVVKESKKKNITDKLQSFCFEDPEIKYLGQKAFISYVRSINVQHNKDIFDVNNIPFDKLAASFGLPGAPKVRITGNAQANSKERKNMPRELLKLAKGEDDDEKKEDNRSKLDRMFERKNQNVLSEHYMKLQRGAGIDGDDGAEDEEDDGFMTVKRKDHKLKDQDVPDLTQPVSKREQKRALSKKLTAKKQTTDGNNLPKKMVFDDDGVAHPLYELTNEADFQKEGPSEEQIKKFLEKESSAMQQHDIDDKQLVKEKRNEMKRRRKERERAALAQEESSSEDEEEGPNLDRDMASSSGEESDSGHDEVEDSRPAKKPRYSAPKSNAILEVDEPTTLEDLEALSSRLIRNN